MVETNVCGDTFDLFKLHTPEDTSPDSWIETCNKEVKNEINSLIKGLPEDEKEDLFGSISSELGISALTLRGYFYSGKFPLIAIDKVIKFCSINSGISYDEEKMKFLACITHIRNRHSKIQIKAVKSPTPSLAKIAGAHAADGTLYREFEALTRHRETLEKFKADLILEIPKSIENRNLNLRIKDGYFRLKFCFKIEDEPVGLKLIDRWKNEIKFSQFHKFVITHKDLSDIEAVAKIIKDTFGICPKIKKGYSDCYLLRVHSKVFSRYLSEFLEFPYGEKSRIVNEPHIIRCSSMKIRKAFAEGVLMFDGYVHENGLIGITLASRNLIFSVTGILKTYGIEFSNPKQDKNGYWYSRTKECCSDEQKLKISHLFEPDTEKWFRMHDVLVGFNETVKNEKEFLQKMGYIYKPNGARTKITLVDVFNSIKSLKLADKTELIKNTKIQKRLEKLNDRTIRRYVDLLERSRVITKSHVVVNKASPKVPPIIRTTYMFNYDIQSWRIPFRPWLT